MSKEMTKEQACDTLPNAAWLGTNEDRERIEKAVELLCGEPCEELPSAQLEQSEITDEQAILHLQSTGWMQNHDREMYESGLREKLAYDSGSYDSLIPCKDAISRQAAHEAVYSANGLAGAMKNIDALPSVTPKQRTGKWQEVYAETDYRNGWIEFSCENCEYQHGLESGEYGWSYGDPIPWKYCPICGARMVEPQENCDTCKHKDDGWDSEHCDGCCGNNSGFEPQESEEISREEIAALLARESEDKE